MGKTTATPADRELYHLKLSRALIRRIDHLAVDADEYRNEAVEKVLARGLAAIENEGRPEP